MGTSILSIRHSPSCFSVGWLTVPTSIALEHVDELARYERVSNVECPGKILRRQCDDLANHVSDRACTSSRKSFVMVMRSYASSPACTISPSLRQPSSDSLLISGG